MRLASYNVENLFLRARALNQDTFAEGKVILEAHAEINRIIGKDQYTAADKTKILSLLNTLGLKNSDESKFAILRQNRGHLVKRPANGPVQIVANKRSDWIGWVDLTVEAVNELSVRNTARVITELNPDVIGIVEAESRPALTRFCNDVMPAAGGSPYDHVMLIDGNDERGIDVGLMTRTNFDIVSIVSHVDDRDNVGTIFSRDCAHFNVRTANGNTLVVLMNHFKSKGFGSQASSNARRKRQSERVAAIYNELRQQHSFIAVLGDLNDTPDSDPISPLFDDTDLREVADVAGFDDGGRPGTFKNGTASNKIDYILLSPDLFAKATAGGIFRLGVWGGVNGTLFPHFDTITREVEAASDHAAIFVELNI